MTNIEDIYHIIMMKMPKCDLPELEIKCYIQEVEQAIKNYCLIPSVPKALYYTWANMTIDLLNYTIAINTETSETDTDITNILSGNFGTIAMGDTSWKQGEADMSSPYYRAITSHSPNLDDIVFNYRQQLNKFRRIW